MKRYFHIIFFAIVIAMALSCNYDHSHEGDSKLHEEHKTEAEMAKATFVHTVYFWFKEGMTEEDGKFFESELEKLGTCPTILSYRWGKPAGTPRDVVDNSYSYAWIVDFGSTEDQDAYQDEPIHLKFIENCSHLWEKVQVYDTILP